MSKAMHSLHFTAAAILVAGLTLAPMLASAAHEAPDGNNGHGNNISPITGEKVDDASNPNYERVKNGVAENENDGNSGIGNDKNGNKDNKGKK